MMKKCFLILISLAIILASATAGGDGSAFWVCSYCGYDRNDGQYCVECGMERTDGTWTCIRCGHAGNTARYCPACGAPRPDGSGTANVYYYVNMLVSFGSYPQSGSHDPILWRILDISGNEALLMSLHGLDCVQYHTSDTGVTWADSYVREWLNGTFYQTAFTYREQNAVVQKYIRNSANRYYPNTPAGPDTLDKVFLLSVDETLRYLPRPEDRCITGTEYAFSRGAYRNNTGDDYVWWWTRSPGKSTDHAARIRGAVANNADGDLPAGYIGTNRVNDTEDVVIPCIWVNLSDLSALSGNSSAGQPVLTPPPQNTAYDREHARLLMRLSTRSGPSTRYDEPGSFFNDNWQNVTVQVLGKAWGNGIWWVLVDFDYGYARFRVWTGLKRVDIDIDSVPEITAIGQGIIEPTETRRGPGVNYAKGPDVTVRKNVTVFGWENGYAEVEYYDPYTEMYYRFWVPQERFH